MSTQGGEWGDGEGDETSISLWEQISSIVNTSYNEGYEDGQQNRQITNS